VKWKNEDKRANPLSHEQREDTQNTQMTTDSKPET
jgi:hypothetical protein